MSEVSAIKWDLTFLEVNSIKLGSTFFTTTCLGDRIYLSMVVSRRSVNLANCFMRLAAHLLVMLFMYLTAYMRPLYFWTASALVQISASRSTIRCALPTRVQRLEVFGLLAIANILLSAMVTVAALSAVYFICSHFIQDYLLVVNRIKILRLLNSKKSYFLFSTHLIFPPQKEAFLSEGSNHLVHL